MATNAYVIFTSYPNYPAFPNNDSPVELKTAGLNQKLPLGIAPKPDIVFPILEYSADIEQTLNIGSQSTGAGAGKVTFNPLSIRRRIDSASPQFVFAASAGTPFKFLDLLITRSGQSGPTVGLIYRFALCAVKTVAWSYDDEAPTETITFEYGGLITEFNRATSDSTVPSWTSLAGWNRVKNVRWNGTDVIGG